MILSDGTIRENNLIHPFCEEQLQPASYDLLLADIDGVRGTRILNQFEHILASTEEVVSLPAHIQGKLDGKSTIARKGLIIHTAGFIDPGFTGQLTLEITNFSPKPVILQSGMRICQISFEFLDKAAERPYGHEELGSHYQGQRNTTPAWDTPAYERG